MNVNGTGPPTNWISVETFDSDLDETQVCHFSQFWFWRFLNQKKKFNLTY